MYDQEFPNMHDTAKIILREAHELFYEKGYEKASMREIAQRVGISKAAMYHHFENKEEILYTICLQAGEMVNNDMEKAIRRNERSGGPLQEQLTDILYEYTTSYLQNKSFNKILLYDIESLPEDRKKVIMGLEKSNVLRLKNYLKRMMAEEKLRECNLTVLTFSLFSSVHWLFFWYKAEKSMSLREIIESIVDIFLSDLDLQRNRH